MTSIHLAVTQVLGIGLRYPCLHGQHPSTKIAVLIDAETLLLNDSRGWFQFLRVCFGACLCAFVCECVHVCVYVCVNWLFLQCLGLRTNFYLPSTNFSNLKFPAVQTKLWNTAYIPRLDLSTYTLWRVASLWCPPWSWELCKSPSNMLASATGKGTIMGWKKTVANHISDKGRLSKIYKLLFPPNQRTNR